MILSPVEQRFSIHHQKIRIKNILSQHDSVINIKDMGDSIRASCPCGLLQDNNVIEISDIVYLTSVKETLNWLGY